MKRQHTGDFAGGYAKVVCGALPVSAFLYTAADNHCTCLGYFYPKSSVGRYV